MLAQKNRVSRSIFKDILEKGRSFNGSFLNIKYLKLDNPSSLFSFVVPKTVKKLAVDRNLIKRRGYSVISKNLKRIKTGFGVTFFFKKSTNLLKYKEIESEILNLLQKSNLLN